MSICVKYVKKLTNSIVLYKFIRYNGREHKIRRLIIMAFNKVVVAGGGVLGAQIAYQAAYCGKDVTIWCVH